MRQILLMPMESIRDEISRVYWNVNQKTFYDSSERSWGEHDSDPPLGIPGMEWWPYYNWGGSPGDPDWDQKAANRPNFSFEGVEFRWYKHFGRSMNVNVVWPAEKWVRWFERAMQTLRAFETQSTKWNHGSNLVPYPDPSGIVSISLDKDDLRYIDLAEQVEKLRGIINSMACVCIDVSDGNAPKIDKDDWRFCQELEWVHRLGLHALTAPTRFAINDEPLGGTPEKQFENGA